MTALGPSIVVLTRFAVDIGDGHRRDLDSSWLCRRVELFERFCAPGMRAQDLPTAVWIVMVSPETPSWVGERIRRAAPTAAVVAVEGPWTPAAVSDLLRERGLCGVATMRLDSDDVLLPGTLGRLSEAVSLRGPGLYSLPIGIQCAGTDLYARIYVQNPFVCLADPNGVRHVFDVVHWNLEGERVRLVGWRPGWMQVVHEGNLANDVRGVLVRGRSTRCRLRAVGVDVPLPGRPALCAVPRQVASVFRYAGAAAVKAPSLVRLALGARQVRREE